MQPSGSSCFFSRKNTAVRSRASNASKSSWTCCQLISFGMGQKEGPRLNKAIWCWLMFKSDKLMGLRCWALALEAALNSLRLLRKRSRFLRILLIL